jgi:hypothetical protein
MFFIDRFFREGPGEELSDASQSILFDAVNLSGRPRGWLCSPSATSPFFGGAGGGLTEGAVSFLAFGLLFLLPGIFIGVRSIDEDVICESCCLRELRKSSGQKKKTGRLVALHDLIRRFLSLGSDWRSA